ncbi:MAG: YbaB/EbfC family nucleoid-associated protein [Pseudomonadales bacterium]|nr:YbaB/EbfC family nucleoid-associated protein [Pseudomonadales bacterium]
MKMGGLGDLMKQAQEMQEKIANMEVRGESGGGMVTVIMTGRHDIKSVKIDPSLLTEDKEILEDLIAAAVNDAVRKVETNNRELMEKLAGGLAMPPGFSMPV